MATSSAARDRRAASRASSGGIRWDRLTRWALLGLVAVLLLLYIAPLRSYLSSTSRAAVQQQQLQELKDQHSALIRERNALRGPQAIATEARRAGMVKPGEKPYVVSNLPSRR